MTEEKPTPRRASAVAWMCAWAFIIGCALAVLTFGVGLWTVGGWIWQWVSN